MAEKRMTIRNPKVMVGRRGFVVFVGGILLISAFSPSTITPAHAASSSSDSSHPYHKGLSPFLAYVPHVESTTLLSEEDESSTSSSDDWESPWSSTDEGGGTAGTGISNNKPLETLEKLQQMLDETDYMMSSPSTKSPAPQQTSEPQQQQQQPPSSPLWTSKDRSKYKKQQKQQQAAAKQKNKNTGGSGASAYMQDPHRIQEYQQHKIVEQQQRRQQQLLQLREQQMMRARQQQRQQQSYPPAPPSILQQEHGATSSEPDVSDTDDGLGYTLPNLPVYLSDAEGEGESSDTMSDGGDSVSKQDQETSQMAIQQRYASQQSYPYPYQSQPQQGAYQQQPHQTNNYPYPAGYGPPGYHPYPPPPPPGYYYMSPQQQQQWMAERHYQQQQQWAALQQPGSYGQPPPAQFAAPPTANSLPPVKPTVPSTAYQSRSTSTNPESTSSISQETRNEDSHQSVAASIPPPPPQVFAPANALSMMPQQSHLMLVPTDDTTTSTTPMKYRLSFPSVLKGMLCTSIMIVAAYCAVSPRNLPYLQYNQRFYANLRLIGTCLLPSSILMLLVHDRTQTDINALVSCFTNAFTIGYVLVLGLEILATTLVRLGVFVYWERGLIWSDTEPLLTLPWRIRALGYKPKRITLFAADILSSCVAAPLLEEWFKLLLLKWSLALPK